MNAEDVAGIDAGDEDTFVDDGTGMHPTRTAYTSTIVGTATSPIYPTQYATPTPASYHIDWDDAEVSRYNGYIGDNSLAFSYASEAWSEYTHSRDYSKGSFLNSQPNGTPWVHGFVPRYSWDFTSKLTGNEYKAICPSVTYYDDSKPSRILYYWFEEVFNDFQARFGYANYDYALDGLPQITWPGMVKAVRSIGGASQRPIERDKYETWFVQTFGRLDYASPYMYKASSHNIAGPGRPTRFRQAANPLPTRSTRDVEDDSLPPDPTDVTVVQDADMDEDDEGEDVDMSDVSAEVAALQAAAVAKAVAAQAAADSLAQSQAVNAALASNAITQQQAVAAQAASDAAAQAVAVANQKVADATAQANAVTAAVAAGNVTQQQAVAAQAAADSAAQSTALAAQATAQAAAQSQAVATAVATQAASDSTKQQAAVAAQAAAGTAAQQAAVAAQAATDAAAKATALAAQVASDRLKWQPNFNNQQNLSMPVAISGYNFQVDKTVTTMDYSHTWLLAFAGWLPNPTPSTTNYTTLSAAQAAGGATLVSLWNPAYYPLSTSPPLWSSSPAGSVYSGWLRNGSATQLVGWLINVGTSSAALWNLFVTPYGVTSASPVARYSLDGTATYTLTTSSVQTEVLSKMAVGNGINVLGFIYDASVGNYGQVTWLSQI